MIGLAGFVARVNVHDHQVGLRRERATPLSCANAAAIRNIAKKPVGIRCGARTRACRVGTFADTVESVKSEVSPGVATLHEECVRHKSLR